MTVASKVKQCLATLNGIEATLNTLSIQTNDTKASRDYHESSLITRSVMTKIEKRLAQIEREEPQYKGN
ncbi:DUF1657 domain-containing protein [Halalkalibacterium ligniniphilum]|uniref:DUF1657 domain-containing protein n=1 Tax=Halalkalibacterium ligniniphilum TaxID=1134413 RepID=UPI00034B7F1D|nr:DUF1657 domain-containing protein [Halalkalibacterium ligniniphilum]